MCSFFINPSKRLIDFANHYATRTVKCIFFVNTRQLRNSHHRSVSGFAENCTLVGISSLSTATRFAGLAAEGERGNARGRKNDFDHLLHVGASYISLAPTFSKVRARSLRCSSFPNRTRFAGLRFGFGRNLERKSILTPYSRKR